MGELIRTTAELERACEIARSEGVLALDTEFVWRSTYRPKLGIVQMGGRSQFWAIDCLCSLDTAALKAIVEDPNTVKILHDAHQDLSLIRCYALCEPKNVFDTQVAAAFAGFPARCGLQNLLFDAIDVGLPKTETLTDWMMRPLTKTQLEYALDDVRYLAELRDELLKRADELGTRAWLDEELLSCEDLGTAADVAPEEAYLRIKTGRARLEGRDWAILQAVAAMREELARARNFPRAWLGDDVSLIAMASSGKVGRIHHRLHGGQEDTLKAQYSAAIEKAKLIPEQAWPENPNRRYIPEVLEAADQAMEWLAEKSKALHIAPGVIANRAVVTAYVDDIDDMSNPLSTGWRYDVVGEEMADRFGVP